MSQLVLPVASGSLPSGFCPATYQDLLNAFSAQQTVTFPATFAGITVSATKPTTVQQAWLQLDTLGRPVRLYFFAQGAWLSQHTQVPGTTMMWFSALPDFTTFDGGDANPVSAVSGPMWQQALDGNGNVIAARFPLPVGTFPSGTTVAVNQTGGEETHILTSAEMPPHTHTISGLFTNGVDVNANDARHLQKNSTFQNPTAITLTTDSTGGSGTPVTAQGHQNVPPYIGCYLLQRTGRLFYSVN